MSYPYYTHELNPKPYTSSNLSQPFRFAILDPEPDIDWVEVEEQANIRLEVWSKLLGYYTAQVKRQNEIIEHAQFMIGGGLR